MTNGTYELHIWPACSQDMTPEKNSGKGTLPGSRDVTGAVSNERRDHESGWLGVLSYIVVSGELVKWMYCVKCVLLMMGVTQGHTRPAAAATDSASRLCSGTLM